MQKIDIISILVIVDSIIIIWLIIVIDIEFEKKDVMIEVEINKWINK